MCTTTCSCYYVICVQELSALRDRVRDVEHEKVQLSRMNKLVSKHIPDNPTPWVSNRNIVPTPRARTYPHLGHTSRSSAAGKSGVPRAVSTGNGTCVFDVSFLKIYLLSSDFITLNPVVILLYYATYNLRIMGRHYKKENVGWRIC